MMKDNSSLKKWLEVSKINSKREDFIFQLEEEIRKNISVNLIEAVNSLKRAKVLV